MPIVWAVMMIQLRFAEGIDILRRALESACTGLWEISIFFLMQRYSQILQNCGNIMPWKMRESAFISLQVGQHLDIYNSFYRVSKDPNPPKEKKSLYPKIFLLKELICATLLLVSLHLGFTIVTFL